MRRHALWATLALATLAAAARAIPPQGPAGDASRAGVQQMLADVKQHDVRVARMQRLRDVYAERGDTDKVAELTRMLKSESDRYQKVMNVHRDRLGEDAFRRIDRAVTDRRTKRDQRRDQARTDRSTRRAGPGDRRRPDARGADALQGRRGRAGDRARRDASGRDRSGLDRSGLDRSGRDLPGRDRSRAGRDGGARRGRGGAGGDRGAGAHRVRQPVRRTSHGARPTRGPRRDR